MFNIFGRKRTSDPPPETEGEAKEVDGFELLGESSDNKHCPADPAQSYSANVRGGSPYLPYGVTPQQVNGQRREMGSLTSPVENVPFVLHPSLTACQEASARCTDINHFLNRIQISCETLNYDFQLERSVLQEQ